MQVTPPSHERTSSAGETRAGFTDVSAVAKVCYFLYRLYTKSHLVVSNYHFVCPTSLYHSLTTLSYVFNILLVVLNRNLLPLLL